MYSFCQTSVEWGKVGKLGIDRHDATPATPAASARRRARALARAPESSLRKCSVCQVDRKEQHKRKVGKIRPECD